VRLYGATDVGHTREHNEDTFLVADLEAGHVVPFEHGSETRAGGPHGLLCMVADGMGGAAAGEIASAMAAQVVFDELRTRWREVSEPSPEGFATALRDAAEEANRRIHTYARQHPEHRGMGTTATIAGVFGDHVYIAQVGDSRAYLLRDDKLILLTRDQSLMQRLVDAGEISEEQAESSERRNIILQALGPEQVVKIDLTHQQLRLGDTLIVCSDGLSGVAKLRDIEEAAREESDPAVLVHRLIARANELGGPDNITVLVARFEGDGLEVAHAADAVGRTVFPLRGTLADEERTPVGGVAAFAPSAAHSPLLSGALPDGALPASTAGPAGAWTSSPEPDLDARKARARPVLLLLLALGLAASAWLVWQLVRGGSQAG
jgi:protein phosphatase